MLTLNVYVITRKYITVLSKWLCQIAKCLNWGHHLMATSVDAPQKSPKRTQKKVHMGLQLDMASQRCLVADALAPPASRRGKNWKSECRPDMIRMIENHRFLVFFFDP